MTTLTHFVKMDSAERTQSGTSAAEVTQYTIAWTDLTGAGFANNDDVIVLVGAKLRTDNASAYVRFQVGFGSTYAGRTDQADSYESYEALGVTANRMYQYLWFDRRNLVTNENIYFSLWRGGGVGTNVGADDFWCVVLKLSELGANDWGYAEASHSGDAPASYDTSGASFSTGASGDWLLFSFTHFLIDSVTAHYFTAISAGGSDYAEVESEGEDGENEVNWGTLAYRAGLGSGQTCQTRYKVGTASTHDASATKIFGLRLDAFADHWGAHTTTSLPFNGLSPDEYQEFAGNGALSLTATGYVIALGFPIVDTEATTQTPYGRIQLNSSDFDTTDRNRAGVRDNGNVVQEAPLLFGYGSVSSGSGDWDFDIAEDVDTGTGTYACNEQVAAVFTLALASNNYSINAEQGSFSLTGQTAGLFRGFRLGSSQGSFLLSGQASGLYHGYVLQAVQGAYLLTGVEVSLSYSGAGSPTYTLTAGVGVFALTGQDGALRASRLLTASQGLYSLTGQAAGLQVARLVTASQGTFLLTGQPAGLFRGFHLGAAQGAFVLTGIAAAMSLTRFLSGGVGTFSLTGQALNLVYTQAGTSTVLVLTLPPRDLVLFLQERDLTLNLHPRALSLWISARD